MPECDYECAMIWEQAPPEKLDTLRLVLRPCLGQPEFKSTETKEVNFSENFCNQVPGVKLANILLSLFCCCYHRWPIAMYDLNCVKVLELKC